MATKPRHVRDSIREIDGDSWIIGDKIHLTRQRSPPSTYTWSDNEGWFYVVSEAPISLPSTQPLSETTDIKKVYDAGDAHVTFLIGGVFCKINIVGCPEATREHVTIDWLQKKSPSFRIPNVYYHAEHDGRYYLMTEGLPGQTLNEAWSHIDEAMRQHYVSEVVKACGEMAQWHADYVGGVDGHQFAEPLLEPLGVKKNYRPENLLANCKALGMDCSTFVFYHSDLGPGNIIVNLEDKSMGIIDWEMAGFVPRVWIRTKFRIGGGLDLPQSDQYETTDWRRRVQLQLGEEKYDEIAETWYEWWDKED